MSDPIREALELAAYRLHSCAVAAVSRGESYQYELIEWADQARAALAAPVQASVPDDLRASGWTVAVHNDYRLNGDAFTFWLFTKDGRAVKGEGCTDAEALNACRDAIAAAAPRSTETGR